MALVAKAPDSDCNLACQGPDISQSCGAVSRLAVYTDTSATPPSPNTCLTNVDSLNSNNTPFRFNLQAVTLGTTQAIQPLGLDDAQGSTNLPKIYQLSSVSCIFASEYGEGG